MATSIVQFYSGKGVDNKGRALNTVLSFTDDELETVHDFIQWLFPIETVSPVNPSAPIVTRGTQIAFRTDTSLRENLCRACCRMLHFYGLWCHGKAAVNPDVCRGRGFLVRSACWMTPGNHNHLRLTRILKSLRLLGLEACSRSLFSCLRELAFHNPDGFSEATLDYWQASQEVPIDL
jgi:hypothetical protein